MSCIVKSCKTSVFKKNEHISFHKFPKAEWKKQKWLEILQLKTDEVKSWSLVCSKHFQEGDFIFNATGVRRLFPSAMPYLLDDFVESQNEEPTCSKYVGERIFHDEVAEVAVQPNANIFAKEMEVVENEMQISPSSGMQDIYEDEVSFGFSNQIDKKMTLKRALCSSDDSSSNASPKKKKTEQKLETLRQFVVKSKNEIRTLQQKVRRKTKKLATLKNIISSLKKEKLNK